jgi:hypothetical protein
MEVVLADSKEVDLSIKPYAVVRWLEVIVESQEVMP